MDSPLNTDLRTVTPLSQNPSAVSNQQEVGPRAPLPLRTSCWQVRSCVDSIIFSTLSNQFLYSFTAIHYKEKLPNLYKKQLTITILVMVKWFLMVAVFSISLMTNDVWSSQFLFSLLLVYLRFIFLFLVDPSCLQKQDQLENYSILPNLLPAPSGRQLILGNTFQKTSGRQLIPGNTFQKTLPQCAAVFLVTADSSVSTDEWQPRKAKISLYRVLNSKYRMDHHGRVWVGFVNFTARPSSSVLFSELCLSSHNSLSSEHSVMFLTQSLSIITAETWSGLS